MVLKPYVALMLTTVGCAAAADVAEVRVDRSPTAPETAAIKRALGTSYAEMSPFTVGHADLDGDRKPDLLFRSGNSDYCGSGGCASGVLLATTSGYRHESIDLAFSNGAVIVLPTVHQGMHDLRFEGGNHLFRWNGANYE